MEWNKVHLDNSLIMNVLQTSGFAKAVKKLHNNQKVEGTHENFYRDLKK